MSPAGVIYIDKINYILHYLYFYLQCKRISDMIWRYKDDQVSVYLQLISTLIKREIESKT